MNQQGVVPFWAGTSASPEALIKYVKLIYDEKGEIVPSELMTDFGLEPWDENFREADFFTERGSCLLTLLEGFSFANQITPQYEKQVGSSLTFPVNSVILLYEYKFQNAEVIASSGDTSMRFVGIAEYSNRSKAGSTPVPGTSGEGPGMSGRLA